MTVPRHREGLRSPLHDWRVAAAPRSSIAAGIRRYDTPFVGRRALLQLFDETLLRARQTRRLAVRLVGETGIGKTRLLGEFARRGLLLGLDVTWIDDASGGASQSASVPPDPQDDRALGGLAVVEAPVHDAATAPVRLVLVDLTARLDRLNDVCAAAIDDAVLRPTVIVFTASPSLRSFGASTQRVVTALARQRILHEVRVPALDDADLFELASHVLGGPPQARLYRTIASLSEGNPLLAEEVAWDLHRVGLIGRQHGAPYLVRDVPESYVPSGLAAALSAELDALDPELLQTLSSAAVLGPAFEFDVFASALPMPDERILQHLEEGLAYGILREAPDASSDFAFSHELVRRMLYRRLSQIRRRSLHQAMAEALEREGGPTDRPEHGATLAYHFTRGFAPARALDHVLRAQAQAEQARAWDEAIRCCREALDLARQTGGAPVALQIDLLEQLGALYFGQAETFATGASWREALHLCEQSGNVVRRAALTARLAALSPSWCSMAEAEAAVQAARDAADVGPVETSALFDAHHELGLAYQRLGRLPDAIELFGQAGACADPEDWPRCALARVSSASALISAGRPAEAADLLQAALATPDAGSADQSLRPHQRNHLRDPRRIRCLALGELVRALAYLGKLDEAARLAATVVEAERQFGMLGGRGQRAMAQVELARGRPDRALAVLAERMRQSASGSLSAHRVADLLFLAEAYLDGGDPNLALETANNGINLSRQTGAREHLAGLLAVVARASLARGEIEPAFAVVAEAHETIDRTGAEAHRAAVLAVEDACQVAARRQPTAEGVDALTAREREVLVLMADGRTNRQIADVLILSDKTVKRHLSNMFAKLGVRTRAAAVRCAFESGAL